MQTRGSCACSSLSFRTVEALPEVREVRRSRMDLQLGAEAQVIRALDAGIDIVGGIPHFEGTMADSTAAARAAGRLAA